MQDKAGSRYISQKFKALLAVCVTIASLYASYRAQTAYKSAGLVYDLFWRVL